MDETKKQILKSLIEDCSIDVDDLPHTVDVPDGYDMKTVPDNSRENIAYIIKKHEQLLSVLKNLVKNF